MRPSKKHSNKTITIYSKQWDETVTGTYQHINQSPLFEMNTNGRIGLFCRDEFVIVNTSRKDNIIKR